MYAFLDLSRAVHHILFLDDKVVQNRKKDRMKKEYNCSIVWWYSGQSVQTLAGVGVLVSFGLRA